MKKIQPILVVFYVYIAICTAFLPCSVSAESLYEGCGVLFDEGQRQVATEDLIEVLCTGNDNPLDPNTPVPYPTTFTVSGTYSEGPIKNLCQQCIDQLIDTFSGGDHQIEVPGFKCVGCIDPVHFEGCDPHYLPGGEPTLGSHSCTVTVDDTGAVANCTAQLISSGETYCAGCDPRTSIEPTPAGELRSVLEQ